MERLHIQNFAGIKSMDFEFKSVNILIGPQGAGKSVTVKLLYFFKDFFKEIIKSVFSEETKREFDKQQKDKFANYFPKESWPKGPFSIIYTLDITTISIQKTANGISLGYSENIKTTLLFLRKLLLEEQEKKKIESSLNTHVNKSSLEEVFRKNILSNFSESALNIQFFIPAGRSFFANLQKNIYSFLSDRKNLDPFIIEFGSYYENYKNTYDNNISLNGNEFDDLIFKILNGNYKRERDEDFLIHKDSRKVNLINASSGQQETLPLTLILRALFLNNTTKFRATIFIEEPEAHLFPIAQKRIVQLLARLFNAKKPNFQIFITTHSPYILSSFNNLMEAGRLTEMKPDDTDSIAKVIPIEEQLKPGCLCAYSLANGTMEDLIDKESSLISQTVLDGISNEIAAEFGKLLDIEF